MKLVLVFAAFLCSSVETRVTFATSEVIDAVDLKGPTGTTATFKCVGGCRVYSPTRNPNIQIFDASGKLYTSLIDLADLKPGNAYDIPASTNVYTLKNNGQADPPVVFYVVQKGAAHYDAKVLYVAGDSMVTVSFKTDTVLTILSSTGAIAFANLPGALPSIYAMPADSIGSAACRPVYDAIVAPAVLNTAFPLLSPIATIDFKRADNGNSVVVTGYAQSAISTGHNASAVYVSPGYVGCDNVGDSLYTSIPSITEVGGSFNDSDVEKAYLCAQRWRKKNIGLCFPVVSLRLSMVHSIARKEDGIQFTVNDDKQTLYGKNIYSKMYEATSFDIALKWTKKTGSKDRFAMQIDVIGGNADNATATTQIRPPASTTSKYISDVDGNVTTTTKSASIITFGSIFLILMSTAVLEM